MQGSIPIAATYRTLIGNLSQGRRVVVVKGDKAGTLSSCGMEMIGIEPMT